jgi:hypothetical protein
LAEAVMLNKAAVLARFRRMFPAIKAAVAPVLEREVDELVSAMQRAAPVSELEQHPGQFRDSIHAYPNPKRELSFRILADARDEKGNFIGPHIEHGHKAPDGSHVEAVPSFFPTYRARKKGIQKKLTAAAKAAAVKAFEGR